MRLSNCFIHAFWLWIRRGGWLIIRRSHAGIYPHFIHAEKLPPDLECSHYTDECATKAWSPLFRGCTRHTLGDVRPPPVTGLCDWGLLAFLVLTLCAIGIVGWGVIHWVMR